MAVTNWKVPLGDARVPEADLALISDVYRSGWLTMGPRTEELEAAFSDYTGAGHSVAVSSGSAALHLACLVAGIGPGDRVIVPSLTFVATVNAIVYCGAEPIFADIRGRTEPWLSATAAEAAIDERSKAILAVCYGGHPGEIEGLRELAQRRDLILIEDAAHGCGAWAGGSHIGTLGSTGALSLSAAKHVGVGEGGIVLTDDAALAERIDLLRWHGISSSSWSRHHGAAGGYDVGELGFNYRIDDARAALGLARLRRLEAETEDRMRIAAAYRSDLEGLDEIEVTAPASQGSRSSHLMFTIVLGEGIERDAFRVALAARGVQTSLHFPPAHRLSLYADPSVELPHTDDYARRGVSLPMFPRMEEWQRELVIGAVTDAVRRPAEPAPRS